MIVNHQVLVCQYDNCLANGSAAVLAEFFAQPLANVTVRASECQGQCNLGATVRVLPDEIWYCRVKPADVREITQQHFKDGQPVTALLNPRMHLYGI
jgi:(2Fe-2S) ferredoxin